MVGKKTIHGELSGSLPLEMEQTLFAVAPPWSSAGQCTLLCVQGGEARRFPCHNAAHCWHMKRQPSLVPVIMTVIVAVAVAIAIAIAIAIAVSIADAIAVILGHPRCCCRQPLLLPLPSAIAVAVSIAVGRPHCNLWPLPSPLPSAIAIAVAIDHRRRHHRRPSPLPSPSSSPLPSLFEQFKQIMLTLFYLVWIVSGALIAVDD